MGQLDVIMPQMGESIAEGTLVKWLRKVGEKIERDVPLFEISTDKVDAEIPSPASGTVTEIKVEEGKTVPINTVVAVLATDGQAAAPASASAVESKPAEVDPAPPPQERAPEPEPQRPTPSSSPAAATPSVGERVRSSPLVRKIAREHGVDLGQVPATGLSGRITKRDILEHIDSGGGPAPAKAAVPSAAPRVEFSGDDKVVPLTVMRKRIAEHMVMSKATSAHVTTVFEVNLKQVDRLRRKYKPIYMERQGVKLTYLPFMMRAVVNAIRDWPELNASMDGENIVYHRDVNIGIAVALDWGLIVPVVKKTQDMSLLAMARATQDLGERARNKKLMPDEVQGGTFTITNPGIYGALFGTPIISQPQVAIMGMGAVTKRAVVENDAIAIRPMICLPLSFDHRLIDGAVADQFMANVCKTLEEFDESLL